MHFLRKNEVSESLLGDLVPNKNGVWACITAKLVDRTTLQVQEEGIGILRRDAKVVKLPERMTVVGSDGKKIKPSRGRVFYVTTESFDPYHAVTEIPEKV